MSQDTPSSTFVSDTWDNMDNSNPHNVIMKVAAMKAAVEILKMPDFKRGSNSPGPLARARIDEELEKTKAELDEAQSQREYWYKAYVSRLQDELSDSAGTIKEEDEEMTSDQEEEEYDALWSRISANVAHSEGQVEAKGEDQKEQIQSSDNSPVIWKKFECVFAMREDDWHGDIRKHLEEQCQVYLDDYMGEGALITTSTLSECPSFGTQ